ncbi:hypothetical protein B0A55_02724 [Friedmanniomyces simplex]|uniref:Ecp2 effector protein domain-containing protein n=1 Tax=Friedmanniomyces simplex TaxID=329884 RepID=A0A4U0XP08_9PEZI|nr:hypothetical protein B0A55_02724 [Friedmanniomyces simplex]
MHSLPAFLSLLFAFLHAHAAPLDNKVIEPWNDPATATGVVGYITEAYCYTDGYAVSTANLQNTINNICNNVQTMVFGLSGYNSESEMYPFYYPPTAHDDEGVIFASIAYHGNPNCDAHDPSGIRLDMLTCQGAFYEIVGLKGNGCGNLGGVGEDVCLLYWLDPNPVLHGTMQPHTDVAEAAVSSLPDPGLTNATDLL